jgi:hypothetical protein
MPVSGAHHSRGVFGLTFKQMFTRMHCRMLSCADLGPAVVSCGRVLLMAVLTAILSAVLTAVLTAVPAAVLTVVLPTAVLMVVLLGDGRLRLSISPQRSLRSLSCLKATCPWLQCTCGGDGGCDRQFPCGDFGGMVGAVWRSRHCLI